MIHEILLTVAVTLIVNEATDISPWLATRLVGWAAERIYASNADRAAQRKEEWEALIKDSIPTNISKLFFGLGFACAGLCWFAIRCVPTVLETIAELIEDIGGFVFDSDELEAAVMCGWTVIGSTSMPFIRWLVITGILFGLLFGLIILGSICDKTASVIRRHI